MRLAVGPMCPLDKDPPAYPLKQGSNLLYSPLKQNSSRVRGGERTPVYVLLHVGLDRDRDGLPGPRRRGFPATTNPPKNDALGDP